MIEVPLYIGGHLIDARTISRISNHDGRRTEIRYVENGVMNSILMNADFSAVVKEFYRVMELKMSGSAGSD